MSFSSGSSQSEDEFTFRIWTPTQVHCLQIIWAFKTLKKNSKDSIMPCGPLLKSVNFYNQSIYNTASSKHFLNYLTK
jgi:hypothetical protein